MHLPLFRGLATLFNVTVDGVGVTVSKLLDESGHTFVLLYRVLPCVCQSSHHVTASLSIFFLRVTLSFPLPAVHSSFSIPPPPLVVLFFSTLFRVFISFCVVCVSYLYGRSQLRRPYLRFQQPSASLVGFAYATREILRAIYTPHFFFASWKLLGIKAPN